MKTINLYRVIITNIFIICMFSSIYASDAIVQDSVKWGLSRVSVAHVRVKPGHSSELSNQAIMGMPIKLLEKQGDWWKVETPEGYNGYIIENSLAIKTLDEMNQWRNSSRIIVSSIYQTHIYQTPSDSNIREVVTDVVNGTILEGKKSDEEYSKVSLPDGRCGFIRSSAITPLEEWANQEFNPQLILDMAYSMHGLTYLWGGTSTKALDCSGLAKVCYFANGIILRRDAYQQAETGTKLDANEWREYKAGDLLFFGNLKTKRVTHVAIYDKDGMYIHASGRVKVNSIDPKNELYLSTPFFHSCRISDSIGSEGITQAINHPWYFNK